MERAQLYSIDQIVAALSCCAILPIVDEARAANGDPATATQMAARLLGTELARALTLPERLERMEPTAAEEDWARLRRISRDGTKTGL